MSMNIDTADRLFRYLLLAAVVGFAVLDTWAANANPWLRSAFVISVAGCVSYFTNLLAIKMLFQPKYGQVLGWRGLVPKNQAYIARSLGESVQAQLLSPDIVLAYIRERALIERSTQALADWADRSLQQPEVRRELTELIVRLLNERGEEWLTATFDAAEAGAQRLARNPQAIEVYWQRVRAALAEFSQSTENRELVVSIARRVLERHMPTLAQWVDRAIENYLQQKSAVGRLGLGLKNLFSLNEAAIEQLLSRYVGDARVAEEALVMLDAIMASIQADLVDPEKQARLQAELDSLIGTTSTLVRRHLLPAISEQSGRYLNDAGNWVQIEERLIQLLQWLKRRALQLLSAPDGQRYLRAGIERAVQQLDVTRLVEQQVMALDSDELEAMVFNNTGGNLTVVQMLGGVIGLIVGTVQVHLLFAIPLGIGVAVVWGAWKLNERRHRPSGRNPTRGG